MVMYMDQKSYYIELHNIKAFKYIGSMFIENRMSKKEILIRLATATAAMVRLEMIWKSREIELNVKYSCIQTLKIDSTTHITIWL